MKTAGENDFREFEKLLRTQDWTARAPSDYHSWSVAEAVKGKIMKLYQRLLRVDYDRTVELWNSLTPSGMHVGKTAAEDAAGAYAEWERSVQGDLNDVKRLLKLHRGKFDKDPKNWGYAGDLRKIDEMLEEVVDFLGRGKSSKREETRMSRSDIVERVAARFDGTWYSAQEFEDAFDTGEFKAALMEILLPTVERFSSQLGSSEKVKAAIRLAVLHANRDPETSGAFKKVLERLWGDPEPKMLEIINREWPAAIDSLIADGIGDLV